MVRKLQIIEGLNGIEKGGWAQKVQLDLRVVAREKSRSATPLTRDLTL